MSVTPAADSDRHFSGINTRIVVDYLETEFGRSTLAEILSVAQETRSVGQLRRDSEWSSYDQVHRLFTATSAILGGPKWLTLAATETPMDSHSGAEMAQTLQDLGSPAGLLRAVVESGGTFGVSTIRLTEGRQVAPCEWIVSERFRGDFGPFKEFCAFTAGMLAMLPRLYGLLPGDVVEETCCCDGSPTCTFRLKWQSEGGISQQRNYFETRSHLFERRLETLQRTVESLVSASDVSTGLSEILEAASRAMYAPSYILVTDPRLAVGRQMLFTGLDGDEAERISNELIDQCGEDIPGRLVVEVASIRGTYGWIAAIDPGQRHFLSQERSVVQTYAGLAAAVLDSQTSLEEARRQATTARTLLDLSSSLSELTNPQEMASHLADAVPSVIDCDRSMVLLREPDVGTWRVAAVCGYPEATTARLLSMVVENQDPNDFLGDVCFHDKIQTRAHRMRFGFPADEDALASAVARLTTNGEVIGDLVVSVTEQPDRLRERPHLSEALRGMSSQVALAIRNARLMEQVRYQALHDALTGLPNRALLLDRMEQALARSRRHGTEVAAMFIDLDGFKAINDALGHSVGDALLTALAERLRLTVRSDDTLGRLGGDEFIAVLEGPSLVAGPEVIAERILNQVREPFLLDSYLGPPLSLTASIGIACGLRPSAAELLHDADIALYQAKAANKDGWVRYHPDMSMGSRIPRSDSMPPSQSSEGHVAPAKL